MDVISKICEMAVVKVGSEGSWIKRGRKSLRSEQQSNLKDTTGAGDLYAAGFLYGYAMNKNLEVCGQYGSIIAGKVIEILGARMDDQRWNEIETEISEIG